MVDVLGIANAQKQGLARARTGAYVQKVSVWPRRISATRVCYHDCSGWLRESVWPCLCSVEIFARVYSFMKYLLVFMHCVCAFFYSTTSTACFWLCYHIAGHILTWIVNMLTWHSPLHCRFLVINREEPWHGGKWVSGTEICMNLSLIKLQDFFGWHALCLSDRIGPRSACLLFCCEDLRWGSRCSHVLCLELWTCYHWLQQARSCVWSPDKSIKVYLGVTRTSRTVYHPLQPSGKVQTNSQWILYCLGTTTRLSQGTLGRPLSFHSTQIGLASQDHASLREVSQNWRE